MAAPINRRRQRKPAKEKERWLFDRSDAARLQRVAKSRINRERTTMVAFWNQRDTKVAARLKRIWAEQDAAAIHQHARLNDYICILCNRPFTTYHTYKTPEGHRCPPCIKYTRLKQKREWYARKRERILAAQPLAANHLASNTPVKTPTIKNPPLKVVPAQEIPTPVKPEPEIKQPYSTTGPVVVWSPEPGQPD